MDGKNIKINTKTP